MSPILVPTLDELGVEFERARATDLAAGAAADADPDNLALDGIANSACNARSEIAHQIAELPAQNEGHVRLKARALDWLAFSEGEPTTGTDERLAYQLVRALLDGVPS